MARPLLHPVLCAALALLAPLGAHAQEAPAPVPTPAPAPLPPPQGSWTDDSVAQLIETIRASADEGLDPESYGLAALTAAAEGHDPALPEIAGRAALRLAHDYYEGAAPQAARISWNIARTRTDYPDWLNLALSLGHVRQAFQNLLPGNPAYARLRDALGQCRTAGEDCTTLRANLDRWRWLPRDLGTRYLWVNIPAFRLDLTENGEVTARHKVIVGKPGTKTPVFRAEVIAVTLNPWWVVPDSIIKESVGALCRNRPAEAARRGYVTSTGPGGRLKVRQRPGPGNSLGQVKLEMPNPYGVFIHDTSARALFERDKRAFSHGCIRTENPADLAKTLLPATPPAEIDAQIASLENKTIPLPARLPVYVVYFTAEPDPAGDGVIKYEDLYGWDRFAEEKAR